MARIFVTGSSDGLGSLTARKLIAQGHTVVLHARNAQRAADARKACPGSAAVLVADLTSVEQTRHLAAEANKVGPFDAVVHNAGLYMGMERTPGLSGLPSLFAVNVLAPYLLTCLIEPRPQRLVFVSSGLHRGGGTGRLDRAGGLQQCNYSDSKLYDVMLAQAFARRWTAIESNSVDPGWVPTKMGGRSAPDDIGEAVDTFAMLALGQGSAKGRTGGYFKGLRESRCASAANSLSAQDKLMAQLEKISGVSVPE